MITGHIKDSGRFEVCFAAGDSVSLRSVNLRKLKVSGHSQKEAVCTPDAATDKSRHTPVSQEDLGPKPNQAVPDSCLPFGEGDVVEVSGLESEMGRGLNGQRGVVTLRLLEKERLKVRFADGRHANLRLPLWNGK